MSLLWFNENLLNLYMHMNEMNKDVNRTIAYVNEREENKQKERERESVREKAF